MVIMDLDGNKIEGKYNPSSDTATHIELYKAFLISAVSYIHTHLGQQAGHNRDAVFLATVQLTLTICTAKFHA